MRERKTTKDGHAFFELRLGFSRESNDDVRADRGMRQEPDDPVDELRVVGRRVRAPHGAEHLIRSVLQRQVEVRSDAR